jgi:uncharacterized protein YaiE (UPF0345 family)
MKMKKKFPSPSKNKRFRVHAIFAAAICLCMLLVACPPDDPGVNPTPQTAATPTATPAAGEVADNTAITLATATEGAKVYYTQDGTEPNTTSALYSDSNKPVITTGKLTLKAIAIKDGMNNSATLTAVYTIAQPNPPSFGSENTTVTLSPITMTGTGAPIPLNTSVTADNLAWTCTKYTPASGVSTPYAPNDVTALISNAGTKSASVTVKKAGTYEFTLTASNTGSTAVTKTVTVVVGAYQPTINVTVEAVPFTAGTELKLKLDSNNYSFVGGATDYFVADDLDAITYTLSSTNPVKNLSAYNNGNVPSSIYAVNDYPTITQTFSYNEQVVGQRKIVVQVGGLGFENLYEYKPTDFDGELYDTDFVDIYAVPTITLNNLKKDIPEL